LSDKITAALNTMILFRL